ncbi:hypothetical protein HOI83_01750 [Candidatus Uhrbacteria bacterium]|nr:hypothetical protein [Candidatus Uhrbacteria bacterium]
MEDFFAPVILSATQWSRRTFAVFAGHSNKCDKGPSTTAQDDRKCQVLAGIS